MRITVTFFAAHRAATGRSHTVIEVPDSSTVQDLLEVVVEHYPQLRDMLSFTTVAVNHRQAHPDHVLQDGDHVSLFPPIGGG